ncbi:tetratricopeptide repeat protein [Lysobacter sp. GX 14042]|uniref:tetratricopeptide repeat protein n=1 Tax=Lysobacter sp. GX 14042 TaxID=2907155 RepID=UPI001F438585|nr:tetratricopeptide repeat protein [Lysobacter sp. GX 14042]MCE7031046.1 tetratricopeptide repeat protein [Lysobacter sp. GX 14042]
MKADILAAGRPVPYSTRRAVARMFMLSTVLGLAMLLPLAATAGPPPEQEADPLAGALQPLLEAEFALQAGRLDEAGRGYLEAARLTGELGLARRAAAIALLARDDQAAGEALELWRAHGEGGVDLTAAEATVALRKGRERAALKHLQALLDSPGDAGWRRALGVLASADPERSAEVLSRLVRQDRIPDTLQAWLAFGGLAQRLEQQELAERIVAGVVRRFPDEPRVALLHASQLRQAGDTGQAREVLAGVSTGAAYDAELRLAVAFEYDALGDPQAAAEVLADGPQDERSYAMRASLLAQAEDKEALAALYAELREGASEPDPRRRLLLGQIAEYLEHQEEALEWYRGVPGGPQRWVARLRSTSVLHGLERGAEAVAQLHGLQSEADAPDEVRRDAYLMEAALHAQDDDLAAESDAYARGLAAFPDELEILYARALAWERRDDIARAEADLRRILVIEPESVAALNALGYTLTDRTDRHQEALELINRARAAEPDNAAIVDSYGWVLYRLGRHQEALAELRRAYSLQKDAEIAAHVGEVLWVLGRRDEARRWFDQAREIDPDNRSLQRALENTGA